MMESIVDFHDTISDQLQCPVCYELMLTCYLVSDCGHSICGSCRQKQEDQSARRCPVCNSNLRGYLPNIALRSTARSLKCTCKYCKGDLVAENVTTHEQVCGEIPVACKSCPQKMARKVLKDHACPNELFDCPCGARVRRVELELHETQQCSCLSAACPLACGSDFPRKDIPLHLIACPKRIVPCDVPGCHDEIRQSEMMAHRRENRTKHLDLYATDALEKAWSLKEAKTSIKIESKGAVVMSWALSSDWEWPIASPPMEAFDRTWRLVLSRRKLWLQYFRGTGIIRVTMAFFICKPSSDDKKVIVSRSHTKLKQSEGHGFLLPSEFMGGTALRVDCRVIKLAAFLEEK